MRKVVATDRNEPTDIGVPPDVWVWYGAVTPHGDYPIYILQAARGDNYVNVVWNERTSPCSKCDERANAIDLLRYYVRTWK